jgi:hypothetical protein
MSNLRTKKRENVRLEINEPGGRWLTPNEADNQKLTPKWNVHGPILDNRLAVV